MIYNLVTIENKQQAKADQERLYALELDQLKDRFFIYTNYPVLGSHVLPFSSIRKYIHADCLARIYRQNFKNVLFSIGYNDSDPQTKQASLQNALFPNEFMERARRDYRAVLKKLDIGFDFEKEITFSHADFVSFAQKIFLMLYQQGFIYKKTTVAYQDQEGSMIYQDFEVNKQLSVAIHSGEKVFARETEVYVLNINDATKALTEELNKQADSDIKKAIFEAIGLREGIKTTLQTKTGVELPIESYELEYLYGVAFISIRFDSEGLTSFCDNEELDAIIEAKKNNYEGVLFSGNYAINPLTDQLIPIFISNTFTEEVHFGVPCIYDFDSSFASLIDLDFESIIDYRDYQRVLHNSEMLNGLTVEAAHRKMNDYFIEQNIGVRVAKWEVRELIISNAVCNGLAIPLYTQGKVTHEYNKEDLPILYDISANVYTKRGNIVRNNEKLMLNSLFLDAITPLAIRLRSTEGILDITDPFGFSELEKYKDIDVAIWRPYEAVKSIVALGSINYLLREAYHIPVGLIPKHNIIESLMTDHSGKTIHRRNNNEISTSEMMATHGASIIRYSMLSMQKSDIYRFASVELIKTRELLGFVTKLLHKELKKVKTVIADNDHTNFLEEMHQAIQNCLFDEAIMIMNAYVQKLSSADYLCSYQAIGILSCLYIFAPSLAQEIYENVFNTGDFLSFLGMPW